MGKDLRIHSIESFGTHDGPGIRMVIFLQGCNLKCLYCQNADTIPFGKGTIYSNEDIVKRALNMKSYFGTQGGITFSGGEPLMQSASLIPLIEQLKAKGIHINIDTNGTILTEEAKRITTELADLVMFDVKHTNNEGFSKIAKYDGVARLLENIHLREKSQKPYWLRYVLVPGYTDSDTSLNKLVELFAENSYLEKLEILPYHKLGKHKWEMLHWEYELNNVEENTPEQLAKVEKFLIGKFKNVIIKE